MTDCVSSAAESDHLLSVSKAHSSSDCLPCAPAPSIHPHPLSLAVRYFNRDDPLHAFSSWLASFAMPQFPRDRLFECCRDFLSTTLPSWTIACAPDAAFSQFSPLEPPPRRRCPPLLPSLGINFSPCCLPSEGHSSSSVLPFHRCCSFEWRDESGWSVECGAPAYVPGHQSASLVIACSSATAVLSFVITGRVSLGSLSCFRAESLRGVSSPPSIDQLSCSRYVLVAVPHSTAHSGMSDCSRKWLSDLRSITQLECLRSSYPKHDLSMPFTSPFMFQQQQQRRLGLGQSRSFSAAFGQIAMKRANFGTA